MPSEEPEIRHTAPRMDGMAEIAEGLVSAGASGAAMRTRASDAGITGSPGLCGKYFEKSFGEGETTC